MTTPLRVLLVDDSEDDAVLVLRTLRRGGYEVTSSRVDTAQAMAEALDRGAWDIVLSDHDMPDFDSLRALCVRNERRPGLAFVIVSGRIGEDAIVAAMKAGAQDYVLKRELGRLVPAVDRALRETAADAERRRAEEALRASEARYALAVRGSNDGIWDWDVATGEVFYSARFEEMLGLPEGGLARRLSALEERVHPDDIAAVHAALRAHLEQRAPFRVECRVRVSGDERDERGEHRWFSFRGEALWDHSGAPVRMAGSLTDLQGLKRVEEELRDKLAVIERQLQIIQEQREAIRVLMTPVIQVWDGVLMAPVLGALDRDRAASMMDQLLGEVARTRSRHVIIDLTAVESIDAATADHVIRLAAAVELLGARGMVVGIQPRVAVTIVGSGFDLSRVTTLANLREALLFCMNAGMSGGPPRRKPLQRHNGA